MLKCTYSYPEVEAGPVLLQLRSTSVLLNRLCGVLLLLPPPLPPPLLLMVLPRLGLEFWTPPFCPFVEPSLGAVLKARYAVSESSQENAEASKMEEYVLLRTW
jgi:hypothetical protein